MLTKKIFIKTVFIGFVMAMTLVLAGPPAQAGPSLKTDPASVAMSPKAMATMKIIGSGFKAADRIELVLAKADKGKDVVVGSADADASGNFTTRMNILSVLQGFFHFRFKKGKPTPDPKNPPLPPGTYTLKASSWDSKLEATYDLVITAPQKKK